MVHSLGLRMLLLYDAVNAVNEVALVTVQLHYFSKLHKTAAIMSPQLSAFRKSSSMNSSSHKGSLLQQGFAKELYFSETQLKLTTFGIRLCDNSKCFGY